MRIGIDVGGTFTDVVLVDDAQGKFYYTKTLTTPPNLWNGVLNGISKILDQAGSNIDMVDFIVHGTTIGTNALIEKKGAKTGLITTEGFSDVYEIGRVQRPKEGLYNIFIDNPLPLVPRYLRRGVRERVNAAGEIIKPLEEGDVREAVEFFKENNVESIAISLLFSFLNPEHENRIAAIFSQLSPEIYLSLSSEIAPEFREFERTSTTVINAYLQPIMKRYIARLTKELNETYGDLDLRIMQASGGTITAESAERLAINTVNSGPAGGVLAAAYIGAITGLDRLISVDMGGTSFDIGLIEGGEPKITSEAKFEGYPVKIPVIEIDTIGAGGGSIAWIDKGGVLNVGPQSAGSNPGPACYRRGGKLPTVTDANLVLNRLNSDYFLGGEMYLDRELSWQAIKENVADPLGMEVEEAAAGVIRIINAKMAKGISVNSVEKGFDVREFALVAFGGAGALHAVELADELEMKTVVIPSLCGTLSALGLLVSDARHDYVQTMAKNMTELNIDELNDTYSLLEKRGIEQLIQEGFKFEEIDLLWSADIRYEGQSYELNVPVKRKELLGFADIEEVSRRFHERHRKQYSYCSEHEPLQVINIRVTAVGKTPPVVFAEEASVGRDSSPAHKGTREVYFKSLGFVKTPVYERSLLRPGNVVVGPAVIEETISSTVLIPGSTAVVDMYSNLIINLGGEK